MGNLSKMRSFDGEQRVFVGGTCEFVNAEFNHHVTKCSLLQGTRDQMEPPTTENGKAASRGTRQFWAYLDQE